jgi:hypothetical protein
MLEWKTPILTLLISMIGIFERLSVTNWNW